MKSYDESDTISSRHINSDKFSVDIFSERDSDDEDIANAYEQAPVDEGGPVHAVMDDVTNADVHAP